MYPFIDEILADIDWRVSELASIKSIPIKYSLRPEHKEIHTKYSIPAIYAIWEGYIKTCFTIYSNHLNSLSIKRDEVAVALLTHIIDSECNFSNPRANFDTKQKLVSKIDQLLVDDIKITPHIPTESNINLKVLNKILERFCLSKISSQYELGLNKLLRYRNTIAHGENSILVNMAIVSEFVALIENLMLDIAVLIDEGEKNQSYKKIILIPPTP